MPTSNIVEQMENCVTKLTAMRVLLVAENVSRKMGGESGKNFYYFELLQERNIDVRIVCHARVREELRAEFPNEEDFQKFHFIEDNWLQAMLHHLSQWFPYRIEDLIFGQLIHLITQSQARQVVKKLIKKHDIQLVFEPSPITPKGLSFMYDLGVPVVIGPLSGGLEFPPAFRYMDSSLSRISVAVGRFFSETMQRLIPGKLQADTLIVANKLTEEALPKGCRGKVYKVIECGVDLDIWEPRKHRESDPEQPVRFVYLGRFVDWKGLQFLIEAFKQVVAKTNSVLELIGDGEMREQLEAQVVDLNIQDYVNFHGWMKREDSSKLMCECDVFVMPSLREAGGNAALEAMALGLPLVAAKWAGPANTVDPSCGLLVEPTSKQAFVDGLAEAMIHLAESPELRQQMGEAGPRHMTTNYLDWDSKADRIIEIFQETLLRCKEVSASSKKIEISAKKIATK